MNVIRAFIAINLSPDILARLEDVLRDLKAKDPSAPVRWTPAHNIHLTIKFLGDVSVANIDLLTKLLASEAARHPEFEISVGELGAFPNVRRPRVVWVGVQAPPELGTLQHGVEHEMARIGYALEDRPFSPHLTLGRVSRNAGPDNLRQLGDIISQTKVGFLGAVRVREVHLYRSDLRPTGSIYTSLFTAPLATV